MMLTSCGQRGDAERCRQLGISAYLVKPIKQSELLDAIILALGREPDDKDQRSLVTRHTLCEGHRAMRVLLVEDNIVNQNVAVCMLEKEGHTVTVANNGQEALDKLDEIVAGTYDIILMDVQMPVMGGFEASAAIREREKATGKHITIIALTANAMKGDQERCLAAGMDDYIPKPFDTEKLQSTLSKWSNEKRSFLSSDVQSGDSIQVSEAKLEEAMTDIDTFQPIDVEEALQRMEGDRELFRELLILFAEHIPQLLGDIQSAVVSSDSEKLRVAAHSLKGAASNICAEPVRSTAERLEIMGKSSDFKEVESFLADLEKKVNWLREYVDKLQSDQSVDSEGPQS
jgi:CheY-like chemotaxis protein/HPt (histidine-containing phosphotransfer) domain-containing protein